MLRFQTNLLFDFCLCVFESKTIRGHLVLIKTLIFRSTLTSNPQTMWNKSSCDVIFLMFRERERVDSRWYDQHSFSWCVTDVTVAPCENVPCLGVAIVSNLYIHLVRAGRQHGETTGDTRRRPLHSHALLPAYQHDAVIVLASQVGALDGENFTSYTKEIKEKCQQIFSNWGASVTQVPG